MLHVEYITEYQQAVKIDYIKEWFSHLIAEAASGLIPTALEELENEREAILKTEVYENGIEYTFKYCNVDWEFNIELLFFLSGNVKLCCDLLY